MRNLSHTKLLKHSKLRPTRLPLIIYELKKLSKNIR